MYKCLLFFLLLSVPSYGASVALTLRTETGDAGDTTKGSNLTASEVDNNFKNVEAAIDKRAPRCVTIPGATASSDYPLGRFPYAITLTKVVYIQSGGTNWVGQLQNCNSSAASCGDTQSADSTVTSSTSVTSFSDSAIAADEVISLKTTSVSGTNTWLLVCFDYSAP